MKILVLNSGSSSVKYKFISMEKNKTLAMGMVERIGEVEGKLVHVKCPGSDRQKKISFEMTFPDHSSALNRISELITDKNLGVFKTVSEIDGIGHRIVHGGEYFTSSAMVDDTVIAKIKSLIPLAPLHNPGGLSGIETARKLFDGVPNVAVFDTAFHQSMPPEAYRYAIPESYYSELKVRRYGFHGISHQYVSKECALFLKKDLSKTSCLTVHLGNGCSIAAIKNGMCVDTSMGLTPLAGLVMGTRSGDVDPALPYFLTENMNLTIDEVNSVLNKQSGLKGMCGYNDIRDIHRLIKNGNHQAELALKVFCRRVTQYIGQYLAVMNGTDAICFTAGIGENDPIVRRLCCESLAAMGAEIHNDLNKKAIRGNTAEISRKGSTTKILVIPTNEEMEIAIQVLQILKA